MVSLCLFHGQPAGEDTPLTSHVTAQEERTASMEEAARLKGTLAALETQVAAAQSAAQTAQRAHQRFSANAAALQAELQQVRHLSTAGPCPKLPQESGNSGRDGRRNSPCTRNAG